MFAETIKRVMNNESISSQYIILSLIHILPEDKKEEKVCLDIDILLYDDKIIKPEDWEREYVQQSLSALYSSLSIK